MTAGAWLFADSHPRVVGVPFPAWALLSVLVVVAGLAARSGLLWAGIGMAFFPIALEAPAMLADWWRYHT